jgi:hypothetical protein
MSDILTIPIKFYGSTILPTNNCFSLIDPDGKSHKVVNFYYENLKHYIEQSGQTDIKVRCIPKSNTIWEICDERISARLYRNEYCVTCTPLRLLPFEQRKREMKKHTYKKIYDTNDKTKWYVSTTFDKRSKGGIIFPEGYTVNKL